MQNSDEVERLLNIAAGCHDYNGGYHDNHDNAIFHHGVQTVINALNSAVKNNSNDYQANALEMIGRELRRAKLETQI